MSMQPTVSFDTNLPVAPRDTQSPASGDLKALYDAIRILADQIQILKDRLTAAGIP